MVSEPDDITYLGILYCFDRAVVRLQYSEIFAKFKQLYVYISKRKFMSRFVLCLTNTN